MPILVTCICGKQFKVKDELAGKRGKCVGCGKVIAVPAAPLPLQPDQSAATTAQPSPVVELTPVTGDTVKPRRQARPRTASTSELLGVDEDGKDRPGNAPPALVPTWCQVVLYTDLAWTWLVAIFVAVLAFAYEPSAGTWVRLKSWTEIALLVPLAATVSNLRLVRACRWGLGLSAITLGLTLWEQWLRIDENATTLASYIVLALGCVIYDGIYAFAIARVFQAIRSPLSGCPNCRSPLSARAVLCVNCGFDLRTGKQLDGPDLPSDEPMDAPAWLGRALLAAGLCVTAIVLVGFVIPWDSILEPTRPKKTTPNGTVSLTFDEAFSGGRINWQPVKNTRFTLRVAGKEMTESTAFEERFKFDAQGAKTLDTTGYKSYKWPDREATFGPGAVIRILQDSQVREGTLKSGAKWSWTGDRWTPLPDPPPAVVLNMTFEHAMSAGKIAWQGVQNTRLKTRLGAQEKSESSPFVPSFDFDPMGSTSIDSVGHRYYLIQGSEATFGAGAIIRIVDPVTVSEGAIQAGDLWKWNGRQWAAIAKQPTTPGGDTLTVLGASVDELLQRFGPVILTMPSANYPGASEYTFANREFRLVAIMFNRKCGMADFSSVNAAPFADATVQQLLAANSEGLAWQPAQAGTSPTWFIKAKTGAVPRDELTAIWLNDGSWTKNRLLLHKHTLLPERAKSKEPTSAPNDGKNPMVALGELRDSPVLFFELRKGMSIRIANTTFDKANRIASFEATVTSEKGPPVVVRVRTQGAIGGRATPIYVAELDGKPIPKLNDSKLLGLSSKEPEGVVFAFKGETNFSEVRTMFAYDPFNRKEVARQNFTYDGRTYELGFTDYARDKLGRVTSYTTQVRKAD